MDPTTDKKEPKISYIVPIAGTDLFVGSGIYLTTLNKSIKEKITQMHKEFKDDILLVIFIFIILSIIFGYLITKYNRKDFPIPLGR